MTEIDLAEARTLCTAAEMKLVEAASHPAIDGYSASQLKQKVDRARKFRDKWRDVYTTQRRATQAKQDARTTEKNARSRRKSRLFGQVLAQFQSALKGAAQRDSAESSAPTRTRPLKSKRTAENRKARAKTRTQLKRKKVDTNAVARDARSSSSRAQPGRTGSRGRAPAVESPPSAPAAMPIAGPAPIVPAAAAKAIEPSPETMKPSAAKKPSIRKKGPAATAPHHGLPADPLKQVAARGAANRARVKASGLDTRVRGHVSARTRRTQARRDARN